MKNLIASFLFLVLPINLSASAFDSTSTPSAIDVLLFDGYSIYFRAPLSERVFARLGLTASIDYSDMDDNLTYHDESTYSVSDRKTESKNASNIHRYSLSASIHSFLVDIQGVSFYLSAGPVLTYSRNSSNYESKYMSVSGTDIYKSKSTDKRWGVGALVGLGLQAPVSNTISIIAEYQFSAEYLWGDRTTDHESYYSSGYSKSKGTGDIKGMSYSLSSLKLGLAINL